MTNSFDDDPDRTDPETGLYLAITGVVGFPCPTCGKVNTMYSDTPTNRFQFQCSTCGEEYVAACTLVPTTD